MMPLIQSRCMGHFANFVPVSLHSGSVIFLLVIHESAYSPQHHTKNFRLWNFCQSDCSLFFKCIPISLSFFFFLVPQTFLLQLFSSSLLKQTLENPLHVLWLRSLCASWIFGFMHSNSRNLFTVISLNSAFSTFCGLPSFSSLSFN